MTARIPTNFACAARFHALSRHWMNSFPYRYALPRRITRVVKRHCFAAPAHLLPTTSPLPIPGSAYSWLALALAFVAGHFRTNLTAADGQRVLIADGSLPPP